MNISDMSDAELHAFVADLQAKREALVAASRAKAREARTPKPRVARQPKPVDPFQAEMLKLLKEDLG